MLCNLHETKSRELSKDELLQAYMQEVRTGKKRQ